MIQDTGLIGDWLREWQEKGLQKGMEKGMQQGLEQGLEQGTLKGLNQAVLKIVTQRFPKLVRLAKKQIAFVKDTDVLLDLIGKLTTVQSIEEATECLLALDENEEQE